MTTLNENERIDDLNINGLRLVQNKEYFLFGIDSVILSSIVKSSSSSNTILDFCTGSAVIPVLLTTRVKFKKIIGIELQEEMYKLAIRNVKLNKLEEDIDILNLDIKDYKSIEKELSCKADIIVCNPPYKKKGTGVINENSVKYIARHEEKCTLEDIFISASKLLKNKGKLYLVHKPERIADLIAVSRKYGLEAKNITIMQPNKNKKASLVFIEYVKGGGVECTINPVIIQYDENGSYTNQIKEIYRMDENNE